MLEANLSAAGLCVLLATEPSALDGINVGQIFPYLVGAMCVLGVVVVGLVMSRSNSTGVPSAANDPSEGQLVRLYSSPNHLWKLVVPAIVVLGLGGAGFYFVLPVLKNVADVKASWEEQMKANQEAAKKKSRHDSFVYYPRGSSPAPKPTPPRPQPLVPGFEPPPPPNLPPTYIDSRGTLRIR